MMSYITDAAPQAGEVTMRAGLHAEVGSHACTSPECYSLSSQLLYIGQPWDGWHASAHARVLCACHGVQQDEGSIRITG